MAKKKNSGAQKTGVDRWREETHAAQTAKKSDSANDAQVEGGEKSASKKKRPMTAVAKRRVGTLVVTGVLCVAAVAGTALSPSHITGGLDFAGGSQIELTADSDATTDQLTSAASLIETRLNSMGVSQYKVEKNTDANSLTVKVLGSTDDQADTLSAVAQTGKIEFVRVDTVSDAEALAKIDAGTENVKLEEGSYEAFLDSSAIKSISVTASTSYTGYYTLGIEFTDEAGQTFSDVTGELATDSGKLAIVMDGVVKTAASVSSQISGGEVSVSGFSYAEAYGIKAAFDSGNLPVSFTAGDAAEAAPALSTEQIIMAAGIAAAVLVVAALVSMGTFRLSGLLALGTVVVYAALELGLLAVASAGGAFHATLFSAGAACAGAVWALVSALLFLGGFKRELALGKTPRTLPSQPPTTALPPTGSSTPSPWPPAFSSSSLHRSSGRSATPASRWPWASSAPRPSSSSSCAPPFTCWLRAPSATTRPRGALAQIKPRPWPARAPTPTTRPRPR